MELRKTAVATSVASALACVESLLDWMCFSSAIGRPGKAFGFWLMRVGELSPPSSLCRFSEVASSLIFCIALVRCCE